jgi:hypothetical protein
MSGGYQLHPAAYDDLDGIWEFIGEHDLDAADRVIADKRPPLPDPEDLIGLLSLRPGKGS